LFFPLGDRCLSINHLLPTRDGCEIVRGGGGRNRDTVTAAQEAPNGGKKKGRTARGMAVGCSAEIVEAGCALLLPNDHVSGTAVPGCLHILSSDEHIVGIWTFEGSFCLSCLWYLYPVQDLHISSIRTEPWSYIIGP